MGQPERRARVAAVVELRARAPPGAAHKVQRERARGEARPVAVGAREAQERGDRGLIGGQVWVLKVREVQARLRGAAQSTTAACGAAVGGRMCMAAWRSAVDHSIMRWSCGTPRALGMTTHTRDAFAAALHSSGAQRGCSHCSWQPVHGATQSNTELPACGKAAAVPYSRAHSPSGQEPTQFPDGWGSLGGLAACARAPAGRPRAGSG